MTEHEITPKQREAFVASARAYVLENAPQSRLDPLILAATLASHADVYVRCIGDGEEAIDAKKRQNKLLSDPIFSTLPSSRFVQDISNALDFSTAPVGTASEQRKIVFQEARDAFRAVVQSLGNASSETTP